MNSLSGLKAQAVIAKLISKLEDAGSWCGETHIQKATYFLKVMFEVPLEYDFILYKHGPYSFELRSALARMKANNTVFTSPREPYGPSFKLGALWPVVEDMYPKTLDRYGEPMGFVAKVIGSNSVIHLEGLATALYVTVEFPRLESVDKRASKLIALKPHVSKSNANAAVELVDEFIDEAGAFALR